MSVESGEERLSAQEMLLLAVEAASVGVWELTLPSNQVRWSLRCNEIFGLPPEAELSYGEFLESVHLEDRSEVDRVVKAVLDPSGSGNYELDYRILRPSGEVRWVAAKGKVFFRHEQGLHLAHRFVGTLIDHT